MALAACGQAAVPAPWRSPAGGMATHGAPAGGMGKAASQNGVFITAIHHRGGLMRADGGDFSSWFTDK